MCTTAKMIKPPHAAFRRWGREWKGEATAAVKAEAWRRRKGSCSLNARKTRAAVDSLPSQRAIATHRWIATASGQVAQWCFLFPSDEAVSVSAFLRTVGGECGATETEVGGLVGRSENEEGGHFSCRKVGDGGVGADEVEEKRESLIGVAAARRRWGDREGEVVVAATEEMLGGGSGQENDAPSKEKREAATGGAMDGAETGGVGVAAAAANGRRRASDGGEGEEGVGRGRGGGKAGRRKVQAEGIGVILLDGTWGQAKRMNRRLSPLLPRLKLEEEVISRFLLRRQSNVGRVSTLEAASLLIERLNAGPSPNEKMREEDGALKEEEGDCIEQEADSNNKEGAHVGDGVGEDSTHCAGVAVDYPTVCRRFEGGKGEKEMERPCWGQEEGRLLSPPSSSSLRSNCSSSTVYTLSGSGSGGVATNSTGGLAAGHCHVGSGEGDVESSSVDVGGGCGDGGGRQWQSLTASGLPSKGPWSP